MEISHGQLTEPLHCSYNINKKVLQPERKRHTARRIASTRCAALSPRGYLPWLGVSTLAGGGGTYCVMNGATYPGQGAPTKGRNPPVGWEVGTPWSAGM